MKGSLKSSLQLNRVTSYYTPTLREFHPGFKYEYQLDGKFHVKIFKAWTAQEWNVWVKEALTNRDFDGKAPPTYRVKYMTRKDIESLNWEWNCGVQDTELFIAKFHPDPRKRKLFDAHLSYDLKEHTATIAIKEGDFTEEVFKGILKNKSELNYFSRVLGIINIRKPKIKC